MKRAGVLAVFTAVGLVVVGCGDSDQDQGSQTEAEQVDPQLGSEQTAEPDEDSPEDEDRDDQDSDAEQATESAEAAEGAENQDEDTEAEAETQGAEEVWVMPESHAEAEELAVAQAEDLQRQIEQEGHPQLDGPGIPEDPEQVARLTAAIATTHYPAIDWNRTQALVRSSFLYSDSVAEMDESTSLPQRPVPAGDESWTSAAECEAEPEVRVEDFETSESAHVPVPQVVAEYRWVDGVDGCDLVQPDHQMIYSIDVTENSETGEQEVVMVNADRIDLDDDQAESLFG